MEEMELGPNGALLYCMEYLMDNTDWLQEQLNEVGMDDYVLFDCPGQIELYSHLDVFRDFTKFLQSYGTLIVQLRFLPVHGILDGHHLYQ